MLSNTFVSLLVTHLLLFTTTGLSQDPQAILEQVSERYGQLRSYQFIGKTVAESDVDGKQIALETAFEIAFVSPKSIKVEFRYPGGDSWIRLSDGTTLVRFRSTEKNAQRQPSSSEDLYILKSTFIGDLEKLPQTTSDATLVGSESLPIEGTDVDCYIIEARQRRILPDGTEALPTKWWIDKNRIIVLKQVSGTRSKFGEHVNRNMRTLVLSRALVDQPVPEQLFQYASKQR